MSKVRPAKGIVIQLVGVQAKGTRATLRKCVKVKLIASGKVVLASVPGDGNLNYIGTHDEVMLMPKKKRDLPQAKYEVLKVANCTFNLLNR